MLRSSRPEVRNPLLALPAARELAALLAEEPELARRVKRLALDLKAQCRANEAEAIRKRKGPMVSYWMSTGTWCRHLSALIRL
jgi:hypothetical protein